MTDLINTTDQRRPSHGGNEAEIYSHLRGNFRFMGKELFVTIYICKVVWFVAGEIGGLQK